MHSLVLDIPTSRVPIFYICILPLPSNPRFGGDTICIILVRREWLTLDPGLRHWYQPGGKPHALLCQRFFLWKMTLALISAQYLTRMCIISTSGVGISALIHSGRIVKQKTCPYCTATMPSMIPTRGKLSVSSSRKDIIYSTMALRYGTS